MIGVKDLSGKAVARDVLIIVALTAIAGFFTSLAMPGKLGTTEYASIVYLLSLVFSTIGFTIIACFSPNNRWRQLFIVGVLTWIVGGIINIPFFGLSFIGWLKEIVFFVVTVSIGGAFSYLFTTSKSSVA
jgi:hypothetical protein